MRALRVLLALTGLAATCPPSFVAALPRSSMQPQAQDTTRGRQGGGGGPAPEGPKPYAQVITRGATTDSGVFIVHRLNDKLFYEIPRAALERPFLLVARYTATPQGQRYAGEELVDRVVRWQRRGTHVLLRDVSYAAVADSTQPVSRAVRLSNFEPVLMNFDVATLGPNADSNAVIEATRLYTTDVPELSARRVLRGALDPARSLIERATTFPTNVEVEALQTYRTDSAPGGASSSSVLLHYSMVLLPERLMRSRLCDNRVGFFSIRQDDYGTDQHRVAHNCFITRWLPSPIENAYGPHISDPRSGEILQSTIGFYHNVMNLVRDWYLVQAGPSDPRAARLPLPDSMMGEFLAYVTAHEVGHTLGFPHNMK